MALPVTQPGPKPRFNETTYAIVGSFILSLVLATILVGSPFRALRLAYLDYSHTPAAAGVPESSPVNAPQTESRAGPSPSTAPAGK